MADSIHKLALKDITKTFHGKYANKQVNLNLEAGDIVGLLGENGAGKTTLMNILFGLYQPDSGSIEINDQPVRFPTPRAALKAGIGMVHQHFMLVPNHSVLENIASAYLDAPFFNPYKKVSQRIKEYEAIFRLGVDPQETAFNLSAGELQRVEIMKALLNGAQVLILDEPTSVLSPVEAEELFVVLRRMAAAGKIIIIISHKLEEILALCKRVVVLRKGEITGSASTQGADKAELARMMVGREISFHSERAVHVPGAAILEVSKLLVQGDQGKPAVQNVSFTVHQNEIFGIAGVSGNGQRELAEAINGLRQVLQGSVYLDGANVTNAGVKHLSGRGMAHIPEERMRFGIVPNLLLYENAVLKDYHTDNFSDDLFLKKSAIHSHAEMIVENFRVAAPTIHSPIKHLSGGNIQKLILGREISGDPTLLVAAHPTYGLDIGATEYIRSHLIKRRDQGGAILLISEDLEEIMELSDRIGIMYEGRFMAICPTRDISSTEIGLMMAGVLPDRFKSGEGV